jgi:hypothetical protein
MRELDQDLKELVDEISRRNTEAYDEDHEPLPPANGLSDVAFMLGMQGHLLGYLVQAIRGHAERDWVWLKISGAPTHAKTSGLHTLIDRNDVRGIRGMLDVDGAVGYAIDLICSTGPVRVWWSGHVDDACHDLMHAAMDEICKRLSLPRPPRVPER